jgi:hypothetical protein
MMPSWRGRPSCPAPPSPKRAAPGVFLGQNIQGEPTTIAFERLQTAPGWAEAVASPRAVQLISARRVGDSRLLYRCGI